MEWFQNFTELNKGNTRVAVNVFRTPVHKLTKIDLKQWVNTTLSMELNKLTELRTGKIFLASLVLLI